MGNILNIFPKFLSLRFRELSEGSLCGFNSLNTTLKLSPKITNKSLSKTAMGKSLEEIAKQVKDAELELGVVQKFCPETYRGVAILQLREALKAIEKIKVHRPIPEPGEVWRHYKGDEYRVFVVAIRLFYRDGSAVAEEEYYVLYGKSEHCWHVKDHVFVEHNHEIYKVENKFGDIVYLSPTGTKWTQDDVDEDTAWARKLTNFMETVSFPAGSEFSNCFRFERLASRLDRLA